MESTKTITVLSVYSDEPIRNKQYDEISRIASRYVGTIYRLADDSVIIIFGLPASYENDHERAVEAAGELRSNYSFRIGISTGDLLTQTDVMLDYKRMELTTEACNLARTAEPGKIFINSRLYSMIENTFRCEPQQQSTGRQCYEIIGISEQLKQKLKSRSSRRKGHSRRESNSIRKHRKTQKLKKSRAKFSRKFKKLTDKNFGCIYYLLIVIAIIVSVLVILVLGC